MNDKNITGIGKEITEKYGIVYNCLYLNARKDSSTDAEIITVLPIDTKVKILGTKKGFYKIELEDGDIAFVMKEFINKQ